MATEVKRYLAADGTEFLTAEAADRHDVAVTFCKSVQPKASREVYDAVVEAQRLGWTFYQPPNPAAS